MTEDQLKAIISQGTDADKWLNHPVFTHVLSLQKAKLIHLFEKTKFKEHEERDEIWRKIQALESVRGEMAKMIRDARQAETRLEKIKKGLKQVVGL